jgi:hypothetical protein
MSPDMGQASKPNSMFSKIQRVFIKGRDREERQRDLRIDLDLLSGIGPLGKQVISSLIVCFHRELNQFFPALEPSIK